MPGVNQVSRCSHDLLLSISSCAKPTRCQYAIPPGVNMTYCFGTETNYGAYWYHVHLRDIYQDGVRGPILIQPDSSVARPYNKISTVQDDVNAMLQAEQAPVVLMVNDWFHQTSTEIGLRLAVTNDSMRPLCANSILFNGMGSVQCPPSTPGLSSFGCADMSSMGGMGRHWSSVYITSRSHALTLVLQNRATT